MSGYTCPHCSKRAISFLRKSYLGPATSATCQHCGNKVSVPFSAMLAVIPFVAGILGSSVIGLVAGKYFVVALGFVVMAYVHHRYVPLSGR
ncbi:MAG TPA: hypothetical protein VLC92_15135 [Rhodocyclaceae bacterium]|nr:hypothetical protein [Rhodocyclaceae bacterium]